MKQYEDELYSQWLERVEATLPNLLKRTVLCKPPSTPTVQSSVHTPVSGDSSRTASRAATVMDFSHIIPPGTHFSLHQVLYHTCARVDNKEREESVQRTICSVEDVCGKSRARNSKIDQ